MTTAAAATSLAPRLAARAARAWWVRNLLRSAGLAVAVGVLLALGSSYDLYVFSTCMLAAISAIALNLLVGTAGQVSLGTVAFLALGGFMTAALLRAGVPFGAVLPLVALAAVVGGVLLGLPSLRIRGLYLALATFGAYFIVIYIGQRYQNSAAGPAGFVLQPLFAGTDVAQQRDWAVLLTGLVAVTALVTDRLTADRIGRALRLIRDQEAAAPALGIDVTKYKLAVFVVSSVITGLAGAIGAEFVGNVSTDNYTLTLAIAYLAMILIGGFDSVTGAIVGAVAVTLLPIMVVRVLTSTAGSEYATLHGTEISSIIYGLVIVVLATRAPGGLSALAETVWRAPGRARASRRLRAALD